MFFKKKTTDPFPDLSNSQSVSTNITKIIETFETKQKRFLLDIQADGNNCYVLGQHRIDNVISTAYSLLQERRVELEKIIEEHPNLMQEQALSLEKKADQSKAHFLDISKNPKQTFIERVQSLFKKKCNCKEKKQ